VVDALLTHNALWLWAPAFAGATEFAARPSRASYIEQTCQTANAYSPNTVSRSRGIICPSFALELPALLFRGRGEDRVLAAPAVPRANAHKKMRHTSIQVQREHPGLPCAMALRLTSCSSRRTAFLPPSPRGKLPHDLTPAPRRPNHTTSPYAQGAYVSRASRVHRIPPHVRDDRERPSMGETGGDMRLICATCEAEYF
jgi:hypothetical protein